MYIVQQWHTYCLDNEGCGRFFLTAQSTSGPCDIELRYRHVTVILYHEAGPYSVFLDFSVVIKKNYLFAHHCEVLKYENLITRCC